MKIIKRTKYYVGIFLLYMKMGIQMILEYPAMIMGWLLSNPIQFIVGFATIKFVVAEFGDINGWDYGQLAFLYGLSVISHALSMIFFVQGWFMGWFVIEGDFDRYLTRPLSVPFQFFFTNINVFGVTDLVPGIIVFIYGFIKTQFRFSIVNILVIIVMLTGATLIRGGIYILLGTTSFWTKSTTDFGPFCQEIFDRTTMYPLSMYPESLQFILTYIIPIGWVSFYPTSAILDMNDKVMSGIGASLITLLVGIVVILVSIGVFSIGLKKYESAGN